MRRRKIAVIAGQRHPSRNSVERMIRKAFPECTVKSYSPSRLFKWRWIALLANLFYVYREFGDDLHAGRRRLANCFFKTHYIRERFREHLERKIRPDKYWFTFQLQSLFDGSVPGVPHFVYTDHTHLANLEYPGVTRSDLRPKSWIEYERRIYQNAKRVFTRSHNIRRSLIDSYSIAPDKVVCVYAGSNIEVTESSDENRYRSKQILFVGWAWERKGGPTLIEAFKRVLPRYPGAKLKIVGASPELYVPNCEVVGAVPLEQLSRHYAEASIFCLPTTQEPFGIAFIEAMLHGLPVIGTRLGAQPDFIRPDENGYLVEPGNVEQIVEALAELLGDPERCRAYGERGREIAASDYTWDKVGERIRENILAAADTGSADGVPELVADQP